MTEKVKPKIEKVKKIEKKKNPMGELTDEEREAVTIVFHQFETGLREGTIFTKVHNSDLRDSHEYLRNFCLTSGFSQTKNKGNLIKLPWLTCILCIHSANPTYLATICVQSVVS